MSDHAWPSGAAANLMDAEHVVRAVQHDDGPVLASTRLVRGDDMRLRTEREVTIPAGSLIEHVVTPRLPS